LYNTTLLLHMQNLFNNSSNCKQDIYAIFPVFFSNDPQRGCYCKIVTNGLKNAFVYLTRMPISIWLEGTFILENNILI
jgi:hypothetical protein